jgi:hypothetical protein
VPVRVGKAYRLVANRGGPSIRPTASETEVPDLKPGTWIRAELTVQMCGQLDGLDTREWREGLDGISQLASIGVGVA